MIKKIIHFSTLNSALFILIIVSLIYILFAGRFIFTFPTEPANYFSHQAYSLLQNRLDLIDPAWTHDLSKYNNKFYLYWGPTPVLFILPIVLIFGVNVSDVLYTALFATLGPLFIYLILENLEQIKILHLKKVNKIILSLFFAFGTVYFSIAVKGSVWFTSQIFSTIYVLISLYLITKFPKTSKLKTLAFSTLFLGLGIWGRTTFIFYIPVFIYFIFENSLPRFSLKQTIKSLLYFGLILFMIFVISSIFNFLRFGSIFENGYSYQNLAPRFVIEKEKYGYLNPIYIPHNFYYNFIHFPPFKPTYPFFGFDPEGNSFILLSPLFFLVFLIFRPKHFKDLKIRIFNLSVIFSITLIIFFQLNFWGTGWFQFNARYLLDCIPLLIILLAEILDNIPWTIIASLVTISIIINTLGTLWLIGLA